MRNCWSYTPWRESAAVLLKPRPCFMLRHVKNVGNAPSFFRLLCPRKTGFLNYTWKIWLAEQFLHSPILIARANLRYLIVFHIQETFLKYEKWSPSGPLRANFKLSVVLCGFEMFCYPSLNSISERVRNDGSTSGRVRIPNRLNRFEILQTFSSSVNSASVSLQSLQIRNDMRSP